MHYRELDRAWQELTAPGAQFEIAKIAVRGQRLRSYRNAQPSVREFWLATQEFADREYLVYQGERITYREAHSRTAAIAAWLFAQGVKPGDRVAIDMRNYPEWMLIYWACLSVGVAAVGMNAWWVPDEIDYALRDSAPKVVFCDQERLDRILQVPAAVAGAILVGVRTEKTPGVVPWDDVVRDRRPLPDVRVDSDADACIFYTSGTTGFPKGAQLTHRGCISNLWSMQFIAAAQALATARATNGPLPSELPVTIPVGLVTTPLFHVTANNCTGYSATAGGGKLVLMYRWDPAEALRLIEKEKVTAMSGVPVMSRELVSHPEFASTDTSSLVSLGGGGAPLLPDLVDKIEKGVKTARPITGYGLTEVCGIITQVAGDFFVDKPASVGRVMPVYEARCVDDAGKLVSGDEIGELCVKGAPVIKGYLNRPEATAEAIVEGWFHTGDLARIDKDGFVFIVDRKKDMVLRGGENVYCAEVEGCLFHHPDVAECCVFGVPDARLGEEVGAAVLLKPGARATAQDLRAHCSERISKYKVPRYIWLIDTPLPRNASGKVLKRELRQTLHVEQAN
jgi:long-chain acyl-CoA synthetase